MIIKNELAVLTRSGSNYGIEFLENLLGKNIKPGIICVEKVLYKKRFKMARFLSKKIGILDSIRYNLKFWIKPLLRTLTFGLAYSYPNYFKYSDKVIFVNNINSDLIVSVLNDKKISKIILAQSGIIRRKILSLPNKWIINCHPGNIPYYRGVDCIKWALYNEDEIYVTLHLVDTVIDTGYIIEQFKVPIYKNDTIKTVENRANAMCINQLVKSINLPDEIYKNAIKVDSSKGEQYYLMPNKILKQLKFNEDRIIDYLSIK